MKNISSSNNLIEKLQSEISDVTVRKIKADKEEITLLFIRQIVNRPALMEFIIKPLIQNINEYGFDDSDIPNVIHADELQVIETAEEASSLLLKGHVLIITSANKSCFAVQIFRNEKRSIENPELTFTLKGPRDCFNESMESNLSLIRYRLKSEALQIDRLELGRRTKTSVAVIYFKDIANDKYVNEIKKRMSKIDVAGILESGYVQKYLLNNTFNLFPQMGIAERSDMACEGILEGKVVILVQGSNLALISPKTLPEFLASSDDSYDNIYQSIFSKIIRITSLIFALTLSSLYVSIVSFNSDILPAEYIVALAASRATVPFNAFFEALVMEFISEVLREASIRLPKQVGAAVGIVGTIVIGQAAVAAGLFSPLLLIIVSLATMSSYVAPDFTISNPIRILKFLLLVTTSIFGLYGFTMGLTFIAITIVSNNSFGIPYFAPFAPFNLNALKNYMFSDATLAKKRPWFLNTKDKTRQ